MSATVMLLIIIGYFVVLMTVSLLTSRGADNESFFIGNRKSPWYLVAFGMIGASLSGITFVSVTGQPDGKSFGYMQMVFGYIIGYLLIAYVLLPIYYKWNYTSIYTYLKDRFGIVSYKTGASFFLVSRIAGASVRLLLVAVIMHEFIFKAFEVPFWLTVTISVLFIWLYTFKGGIKTIVWTDTLQTLFMLLAAVVTFVFISDYFNLSIGELSAKIFEQEHSQIFFNDWLPANNWLKQLLAGAVVAFCMTGLDQDMMQKNLSCKDLKSAQKNMISFSVVLVFANLLFLMLGSALLMYAQNSGIELPRTAGVVNADELYPTIALNSDSGLGVGVAVLFVLGLVAAAYSSADSALTSLTTSFCVDFLNIKEKENASKKRIRLYVHIIMSLILIIVALVLSTVLDKSALYKIFFLASLTYGPLLGMFSFGIITKRQVKDKFVPLVCLVAPILCWLLSYFSDRILGSFALGSELLLINGILVFFGLLMISEKSVNTASV
ncbi:MAG: sodium:solute symporter [Crocinitomicaceae bacterium]|nr:sodium:solute symporter [Crocinitomicaceae bacterium]MBT6030650.1 sodium:solute symporter [Crocinitomicaceae bacterium]